MVSVESVPSKAYVWTRVPLTVASVRVTPLPGVLAALSKPVLAAAPNSAGDIPAMRLTSGDGARTTG
ncbi:MAG: hypothetical protein ACRCYU_14070, partial [Nocardioides sp.]